MSAGAVGVVKKLLNSRCLSISGDSVRGGEHWQLLITKFHFYGQETVKWLLQNDPVVWFSIVSRQPKRSRKYSGNEPMLYMGRMRIEFEIEMSLVEALDKRYYPPYLMIGGL